MSYKYTVISMNKAGIESALAQRRAAEEWRENSSRAGMFELGLQNE